MLFCIIQNFCYVLEKRKRKFLNLKNCEKTFYQVYLVFLPQKYSLDIERSYKVYPGSCHKVKGVDQKGYP